MKLILAALALACIGRAAAIHTCNSGWRHYYDIEDGHFKEDGRVVKQADAMFLRVMEGIAKKEGCTIDRLYKLEGCKNLKGKANNKEWGFGAKVYWDCDGQQQVRHIVVGVKPTRKGGLKQLYLYNEDASGWPTS